MFMARNARQKWMELAVVSWPARMNTKALPRISSSVKVCLEASPLDSDSAVMPAPLIIAIIRSKLSPSVPARTAAFFTRNISFWYFPHSSYETYAVFAHWKGRFPRFS